MVLTLFWAATPRRAQQPKSVFYMTREPKSVRSFQSHADKIDILAPNWYERAGLWRAESGSIGDARQRHVPVMPLVVNAGFAQQDVHKFFEHAAARQQAIAAMIRASKDNGSIGFQLDLENVNWTDRDALSDFVRETGDGGS